MTLITYVINDVISIRKLCKRYFSFNLLVCRGLVRGCWPVLPATSKAATEYVRAGALVRGLSGFRCPYSFPPEGDSSGVSNLHKYLKLRASAY